jgi:hypothetical protein
MTSGRTFEAGKCRFAPDRYLRSKPAATQGPRFEDAAITGDNPKAAESRLLKTDYGTGLQPFISGCYYFLGLCPRLIWPAPLALSNVQLRIGLSAEGAASYQPGATPQE